MKKFVQFIAGAVCPNCKSQDTIALKPSDDEIYCVKCDFVGECDFGHKRTKGNGICSIKCKLLGIQFTDGNT